MKVQKLLKHKILNLTLYDLVKKRIQDFDLPIPIKRLHYDNYKTDVNLGTLLEEDTQLIPWNFDPDAQLDEDLPILSLKRTLKKFPKILKPNASNANSHADPIHEIRREEGEDNQKKVYSVSTSNEIK
jgi:hypothetical protein